MTEFRYGDMVFWYRYGSRNSNYATAAVVINERTWEGYLPGGVGIRPEFQAEFDRVGSHPVFIRVSYEGKGRWVHGSELQLVRPRSNDG